MIADLSIQSWAIIALSIITLILIILLIQSKSKSIKSDVKNDQTIDNLPGKTFSLSSDNFLFNKRVLRLVNQKDSELLTMDILRSLRFTLSIEKVGLIYQSHEAGVSHLLVQGERRRALTMNCNVDSEKIIGLLSKNKILKINNIKETDKDFKNFKEQLLGLKFDFITLFPLANRRNGILAWSGEETSIIRDRLEKFKNYSLELFENADSFNRMKELSSTDSLTGLANHRYFTKRLDEELNRCERYKRKLALVFLDLDDFKSINDTYGHLAGDEILRSLGAILKDTIRSIDIVARYGGDEFCVIMPEVDEKTCISFMNRLKEEVSSYEFKAEDIDGALSCTISLGASIYPNHAKQAKKLIYLADMSLLKAKEAGKNRFLIYESTSVA